MAIINMIIEFVELFKIQYSEVNSLECQWSHYAEKLRIFLRIYNSQKFILQIEIISQNLQF